MNHLLLPIDHKLILKSRYMKALYKSTNITSSSDQFCFDLLGSLSNHDDDGNKNPTNLHVWRWKTVFLHVHFASFDILKTFSFSLRREMTCFAVVWTTWAWWWQMFNFVFLCLKRWFQFISRIVRTHFSSIMSLNIRKMIAKTHFQRKFSLSTTSCLLKLPNSKF